MCKLCLGALEFNLLFLVESNSEAISSRGDSSTPCRAQVDVNESSK